MALKPSSTETRFPCDTCGSDLRFNPKSGDLSCDHCGHHEVISASSAEPIRELDFKSVLGEIDPDVIPEVQTATCRNCGAEISFDPATHSRECPFCATPLVIGTGAARSLKPKAVLPFQLDERGARKAMTDWLGGLWFAPSGLQEFARKGRAMDGIYVPYWTYDARTRTSYTGQRGTIYYETRTYRENGQTKTRRVAHTRWQPVSGQVARDFDDILVLASRALPKNHTDRIAPWDLSELVPYDPHYLAGFRAEAYTIDVAEGAGEARAYMDRMITRDIRFDIGGDKQSVASTNTHVSDQTFKHVLLPIWIAAYKYRGRGFQFVVNGQNGAVSGARPYSAIKIAVVVLIAIALAATIGFFLSEYQNGELQ